MNTLAIEINDAGVVVAGRDGVLAVEPGYALAERGGIVTGEAAYAQARLKPRQVANDYWSRLSLEPASAGLDGVGSTAELAYAQLEALWQQHRAGNYDDVLLVVPTYYETDQLGLLLGLAEECGMPVRAMVDAAAAASPKPYPGRQLVYADAGLHRVSVVDLEQDGEVTAGAEQGLEATGLAKVTDSLAKRLAELFVFSTRFDPFHEAASEQQLYDLLPQCLETLRGQDKAHVSLPHRDEAFELEVGRDQLLSVAHGFYRAVLQLIAASRRESASLVVQLSHRLARLPGLAAELSRLDDALVVSYPAGHAAIATLAGVGGIDPGEGQVKLLRHLAWREEPAEALEREPAPRAENPRGEPDAEPPTHVVYRGVAYPVDGRGMLIGRVATDGRRGIVLDGETAGVSRSHCELVLRDGQLKLRDLSRHGTFVNEKRVSGEQSLRPADVIRVGSPGAELAVVRVEPSHGA